MMIGEAMKKKLLGIQGKMVVSYSVVLVLAIVLLMWTAYRYIVAASTQNAQINQQQLAAKTLAQVENYLLEMDKAARQVSSDTRIINTFSRLSEEQSDGNYFDKNIMESIDIATVLASINGPGAPIWRISLYNRSGDFISSGANVSQEYVTERFALSSQAFSVLGRASGAENGAVFAPPSIDRWSGLYGQAKFISLFRPITDYYEREIYGLVEVQQNLEKLEESISLDSRSNISVFVFDAGGSQVLPGGVFYADVDPDQSYITEQTSGEYGWSILLVQSRREIIRPYESLIQFLFLGGAVLILGVLSVVYLASKRFSRPIIELSQKVRNISIGSIPTSIAADENTDELRELNSSFTFMLKRLQDSISVEQRSYLLALQSQMDPHFLFNSLAVISGLGLEEGNDKVVDACDKLGNMLRYSASYATHDTVLRNELENVQNYLQLMKLRYEEYFTYSIDADPRLMELPIPRLVLQPLVENCFEHGFKGVPPPWEIRIRIGISGGRWELAVSDNGKGFSDQSREEFLGKIETYSRDLPANYAKLKLGGMGLVNTIVRLKLSLNEDLEYAIHNLRPTGAEVTIKGGAYDTGTDCGG